MMPFRANDLVFDVGRFFDRFTMADRLWQSCFGSHSLVFRVKRKKGLVRFSEYNFDIYRQLIN